MTNREAQPAEKKKTRRFTIRKDGQAYAGWDDPAVTYPPETLRSMKKAGYRLYVDGKLQR